MYSVLDPAKREEGKHFKVGQDEKEAITSAIEFRTLESLRDLIDPAVIIICMRPTLYPP